MDFRTRKFAGRLLTPEDTHRSTHFGTYFRCLEGVRALKNNIIPNIIALSSVNDFEQSGNHAAKRLYDRIKTRVFLNLPASNAKFKERLRRNVFFEVYDLIRNEWVRHGYFTQIITFLETQPISIQIDFLLNRLKRKVKQELLDSLTHRFTGRSPNFTKAFLTNLLQALRKRLLVNPRFSGALWQFVQNTRLDPTFRTHYGMLMQTGWTRQVNRRNVSVQPNELFGVLLHRFKIATSRMLNRKFSGDPVKEAERDQLMEKIERMDWDLNTLCQQAFDTEINEWTTTNCITRLTKPSFSGVKVQDFTISAFRRYLLTKLRYHLREQLSRHETDSILHYFLAGNSNPMSSIHFPSMWADLRQEFQSSPKSPLIRSKTIAIRFTEQLYSVIASNHPKYPIQLQFTPYLRQPGFCFGVTHKTLKRLAPFFPVNADPCSYFATVPVLQLSGHKIIFNQPIPMVSADPTTPAPITPSSVIRGMGVDLGLKHFAVVSIFEENRDTGHRRELGRHFLDQRTVFGSRFDPTTLQFAPPHRADYNLKRRLEHLRLHQRQLGSITRQMEIDGARKRTKKAYIRKRQHLAVWHKINQIHSTMTQQIAQMLVTIAMAYRVDWIYMEDLRWSQHSPKKQVGTWLAHNQQHFFFGQINQALEDLCGLRSIRVKKVNARWSSQIAWTVQAQKNLRIDYRTARSRVAPYLGTRTRKTFVFHSSIPSLAWQGDADLNAARNIALRGFLCI